MVFKIGDKVRVVNNNSRCSKKCAGQIRKVIEIYGKVENPYAYSLDCGCDSGVHPYEIIAYKDKPISEIDFLNAFKENFKEGI